MSFLKALFSFLIILAVLAAGALGIGYVWFQNEIARPGPSLSEQTFTVQAGEGLNAVAARLETDGLIRDRRLLRLVARFEGNEAVIKAGEYLMPPALSVQETLAKLVEGKAIQHRITIPEGRTVAQALRIVAANDILVGDMPEEMPAEGSLLPDTYFFGRGTTRADLIALMEEAQDDLLAELWPKRQAGLPFSTPYEAVTLASVVEKETGLAEERPEIAGLFVGRLKRGMRLESDPTIHYGINGGEPLYYKFGSRKGQRRGLTRSELDDVDNRWNSYQHDGLPPTPITNPGRDAIAAVLDPPQTEYVFFVADGKGGHRFARTLAEHNRNVALYRQYEREELARERANEE